MKIYFDTFKGDCALLEILIIVGDVWAEVLIVPVWSTITPHRVCVVTSIPTNTQRIKK